MSRGRRTLEEEARSQSSGRSAKKPYYMGDLLRRAYLFSFFWSIFSHALFNTGLYEFEQTAGNSAWHTVDIVMHVFCYGVPATMILFTYLLVDGE